MTVIRLQAYVPKRIIEYVYDHDCRCGRIVSHRLVRPVKVSTWYLLSRDNHQRLRTIRDVLLGASCSLHIPPDAEGQMSILYPAVEEAIRLLNLLVGAPYSDEEDDLFSRMLEENE